MAFILPFLALSLGVKHAFDVDHVVAIGNILTRAKSVASALRLSLFWSLGHLVTAGLLTVLLFYAKETLLAQWIERLELLVPIMLLVIGLAGVAVFTRRLHMHRHEHGQRAHRHLHVHVHSPVHDARKMGAIGLVHGLASNDELLVILLGVLQAKTLLGALGLVFLFSVGVVLGMVVYAAALHYFVGEARRPAVSGWATLALSFASIGYAVYLLSGGAGVNILEAFT